MQFHFIRKRYVLASLFCVVACVVTSVIFASTSRTSFKTSNVLRVVVTQPVSVASPLASIFDVGDKTPQALRLPFRPNRLKRPVRPLRPRRPLRPSRPLRPVTPSYPTPPAYPTYPTRPFRPLRPFFPF